ncbi:MAG: hypothetical protein AUJ20_08150 [Comamonadaceae bacterium CG1_02_60_18]|nr:MAG: hypothetical protein AUJ20_08150 [Comamonadaceae bacterium CG1_02_60_18]PIQ51279.1 MAG: hypothetical protein COW02_15360 [Comamonadaceae bacterium CG12_big_fil_rev_8_21_14_0_65_59_15]
MTAQNQIMSLTPPIVYIKDTGTVKGRGVFAARAFVKDEVVEVSPVVAFMLAPLPLPPAIHRILFNWGYLVGKPGPQAIVLGYGSLYNHCNPANLCYRADEPSQTMIYVAARHIAANEELTINYNAHGGGAVWHDDAWFERMQITPLVEK